MEGTAFRSCQLEQASFKGAWLDNAIFVGARLYGTSFATANARGTNFSDADLRYTSFSGADLTAAKFITSSSGTTGVLGDVLMPDASAFREADLTEIDLAGAFVASEEWLDVLEDESLKFEESPSFIRSNWILVAADREPRRFEDQDDIRSSMLSDYRWRVANPDGSFESTGAHGGLISTPRPDVHTPDYSPRNRR